VKWKEREGKIKKGESLEATREKRRERDCKNGGGIK
jgi:hypothetical protein